MNPPRPPLLGDRRQAFDDALQQPGLIKKLESFARARAKSLRHFASADAGYASQVVQDAIGDTFVRRLTWDPSEVSLFVHLLGAISSRMHHDCQRVVRFARFDDDDPLFADPEVSQERVAERRRGVAALVSMRQLAAADAHVLLLLDAYEHGVTCRSSVMETTGLTVLEYEAAHCRLARLRQDVPRSLSRDRR
jgi:hypothetical protein